VAGGGGFYWFGFVGFVLVFQVCFEWDSSFGDALRGWFCGVSRELILLPAGILRLFTTGKKRLQCFSSKFSFKEFLWLAMV
jgi:hypothetical protein